MIDAVLEKIRRKTTCSAALRWARYRMQQTGLNDLFAGRPKDAIPPQSYDLWNLYTNVRRRTPKTIVEFGCGCSSLVMAAALEKNGPSTSSGHLYTIDASRYWLETVCATFPTRLRPYATFWHTDIEANGFTHRYRTLPDVQSIDLLYLDGPSPDDVPGWEGKHPMALDPVLLEDRFNAGFRMIVDSRRANVAMLRDKLKRKYRVRTHGIFGVTTFDLIMR